MLVSSQNSVQTVLILSEKKRLMKFSNSTFWNGLDYKNIEKFQPFIVFIEVGVDILVRHSLSWRERIVFLGIFEVFLSQCGHNWCKTLEFQNILRGTLNKWPFAFQVYTKKIQEQFSEYKEFKNWFTCIILEVQGVQEFQEFLRSSRTSLLHYLKTFWNIFL